MNDPEDVVVQFTAEELAQIVATWTAATKATGLRVIPVVGAEGGGFWIGGAF